MEEESSVKLHGMWASPYALWVKYALKIKGIKFDYIEEDLPNKSELLSQYNPVYKKVPVLVHNGLPIAESMIILEYIDETWADPPHLLPKGPALRAKHRFWAVYLQLVFQTMQKTLLTKGEAHEDVKKELLNKLDMIEQEIIEVLQNDGLPSFKDVKPGYLDIMIYSLFGTSKILEELFKIELMTPQRYPLLFSWVEALDENSEVKEVRPSKLELLGFLQAVQQKHIQG